MEILNQIQFDHSLVQKKVNFFADYFHYVLFQVGKLGGIKFENYLSLVEKTIYQIEHNADHGHLYLKYYFEHPLLQKDCKYFKEYDIYELLYPLLEAYLGTARKPKIKEWIDSNPNFLEYFKEFREELKDKMFPKAVNSIISYLKCQHEIETHLDDLKYCTNTIVSELKFIGFSDENIKRMFHGMLSGQYSEFYFPKALSRIPGKRAMRKQKKDHFENMTFDQQFEAIINFYEQEPYYNYCIFRINSVRTKEDFCFKYNNVTFFNPKHKKLIKLYTETKKSLATAINEFFEVGNIIVAVVKVSYRNQEAAQREAVSIISQELTYLNLVIVFNGYIDKYTYLSTSDFRRFVYGFNTLSNGISINELHKHKLENTPYIFLRNRKYSTSCAEYFLKFEHLFIEACYTKQIALFWQYLENLLAEPGNPNSKNIIDITSELVVLYLNDNYHEQTDRYILNAIYDFAYEHAFLGMSEERLQYYRQSFIDGKKLNLDELSQDIQHEFLRYLLDNRKKPLTTNDLKILRKELTRVVSEAKAQRNAVVHTGFGNERSLVNLYTTLPALVERFRMVIFDGMRRHKALNFPDLINCLRREVGALLA